MRTCCAPTFISQFSMPSLPFLRNPLSRLINLCIRFSNISPCIFFPVPTTVIFHHPAFLNNYVSQFLLYTCLFFSATYVFTFRGRWGLGCTGTSTVSALTEENIAPLMTLPLMQVATHGGSPSALDREMNPPIISQKLNSEVFYLASFSRSSFSRMTDWLRFVALWQVEDKTPCQNNN